MELLFGRVCVSPIGHKIEDKKPRHWRRGFLFLLFIVFILPHGELAASRQSGVDSKVR